MLLPTWVYSSLFAQALLFQKASLAVEAASYSLVKEYAGASFFDGWDFYNHYDDKTNGDVIFVSASIAESENLAYVDPATNHAIIKVDNTSIVPFNEKRNTVRITTKDSYSIGSVFVADLYHVPYGCSVWPAMWSYAANSDWPIGGEIDMLEGINLQTMSQMGLHTTAGCNQVSPIETTTIVNSTDCAGANNGGCMVMNTQPASYGEALAQADGGVFITEFAESGISIWFFSRSEVPASLTSGANSIDTSAFGIPVGNWPSTGCDIEKFFQPQSLLFTITLCGDYAGNADIFSQYCSGTCYLDYVVGDGSVYGNAYFEIGSVRVFGSNGASSTGLNLHWDI